MPHPNAHTESDWFGIILSGICDHLANAKDLPTQWWLPAAVASIKAGHAQLIMSRDATTVYMLRCWLSWPKPCTEGQDAAYESGDAVLLHWILQPDDIPHLHNHPWDFTTRILAGGYLQERHVPNGHVCMTPHRPGGPPFQMRLSDWHRIASHVAGPGDPRIGQGGTWSLVTTGPRRQRWSFLIDGMPTDAETYRRERQSTP